MGGLSEMGDPERLEDVIYRAVSRSQWCSGDPVCRELDAQGVDGLNRAACHACSLVAETSCTFSNVLLDRVLVAGDGRKNGRGVDEPAGYITKLSEFLGDDNALAVTHERLTAWRNYLRDEAKYKGEPLSAKTINGSYLGAVGALFAWAKGDGLIDRNPMLEVTKAGQQTRAAVQSEIRYKLDQLPQEPYPKELWQAKVDQVWDFVLTRYA